MNLAMAAAWQPKLPWSPTKAAGGSMVTRVALVLAHGIQVVNQTAGRAVKEIGERMHALGKAAEIDVTDAL